jgi:hypothetical protein
MNKNNIIWVFGGAKSREKGKSLLEMMLPPL